MSDTKEQNVFIKALEDKDPIAFKEAFYAAMEAKKAVKLEEVKLRVADSLFNTGSK